MLRLISLLSVLLFSVSATLAQTQIPSDSRLKSVADTKTVKIAYRADAAPFSFLNDKQQPVGYTIDLCKLIMKSIEQQLGLQEIKIEWVPVTVQNRFSTVANGKADMECGSSTVTLGRMKEVDFSSAVFVESTGVIVTKASNIQSFANMTGKKIAVIAGTTNERAVIEQAEQQKVEATFVSVKDRDEAVAALESGKVDAFASDKLLLVGAQIKKPEVLAMLPDDLSIEPYAIGLPRGDWAFRLAVNTGLAKIYRTGLIAEVFKRWFDQIGLRPGVLLKATYTLGSFAD